MSISPESTKMLEVALKYHSLGYNVIPVNKDKKALVKWEQYQHQQSSEKEIESWFSGSPKNIALVTGEISDLFVVDTDTAGAIEEIQNYLPDSFMTPIQRTPHGGKHFFFKHQEGFPNRARLAPGIDLRTTGGYVVVDPSTNSNGLSWHWLEGLGLFDVAPLPLPNALLYYLKEFAFVFNKDKGRETTRDYKMFREGTRDEDLFSVANSLSKDNWSEADITQVIEILAQNCNPPFPLNEVEAKVKSAFSRRERNITRDVSDWVRLQDGYFETTSCYNELQLTTKEQKKAAIVALVRLKSEGIIESYGTKRGCFRTVAKDSEEIDFMSADDNPVELVWPFEIQEWVKILPKNIIVIAGEANAGKTAFLLNVCFMNMGKFKINYFSSEMGAMELRDRLKKFEVNLVNWKENINFRERTSNFADVIKPNDVNIIDFLELTDEFYRVGGMISEIFNRLKKGIAIIALQKNPKTDIGLGGMRSIEKARLYLSMDSGKIKIVKGKNWATEWNPNGIHRTFKLVQGAKFISTSGWER